MIAGIDPGRDGAVVVLDRDGGLICAHSFPKVAPKTKPDQRKVFDAVRALLVEHEVVLASIEKVHSRPTNSGVAAFTFGFGTGVLHAACWSCDVPFTEVSPQAWQKSLEIEVPVGLDPRKRRRFIKGAIAEEASGEWPDLELRTQRDWGKADAAFIAKHAVRDFSRLGV